MIAACLFEAGIAAAILISAFLWYPGYLLYAIAAAVILALILMPRAVRWRSTRLTIEDGKLRHETGILSKSSRTMELKKVQDVRVDQSFAQRLMGMGDLTVETAGESSRITMAGIDRPRRVADKILEIARSKNATA